MLSPHFLQRCSCVHSREGSLHCSKKAECRFYVLYTTRAKATPYNLRSQHTVSEQRIEIGEVLPLGKKRQNQAESPRKKSSSPAAGWPLLCGRTLLCASAAAAMRLRSPSARFGFEYVNTYCACFALAAAADKVCAAGTAASQIILTTGLLLPLAAAARRPLLLLAVTGTTHLARRRMQSGLVGDRGCLAHACAARHALCGCPVPGV